MFSTVCYIVFCNYNRCRWLHNGVEQVKGPELQLCDTILPHKKGTPAARSTSHKKLFLLHNLYCKIAFHGKYFWKELLCVTILPQKRVEGGYVLVIYVLCTYVFPLKRYVVLLISRAIAHHYCRQPRGRRTLPHWHDCQREKKVLCHPPPYFFLMTS